ncbi:3'-exoribonuclease [Bacteroidia bacterium]|nr:3'-exoribonuclease [Bacteroidia bacterium]
MNDQSKTPLVGTYRRVSSTNQELPIYSYGGGITVIDDPKEVGRAVDRIRSSHELGFDTETRPTFRKGEFHTVSLLQLATDEWVYLFRLHKCGFPPMLRTILSDARIRKIGVGIRDDIKALKRLGNFAPAGFVDLQSVAEGCGIVERSFSKLMIAVLGVRISKRQQTSNWEYPILNEAQLRYAATDAWGSLKIYSDLCSKHGMIVHEEIIHEERKVLQKKRLGHSCR